MSESTGVTQRVSQKLTKVLSKDVDESQVVKWTRHYYILKLVCHIFVRA